MKSKARFLPLVVFAAVLASLVFIVPVISAVVTVNENELEWTDSSGNSIAHINASTTAFFYIRDDALETIKTGSATFLGHNSDARFFDVVNGEAGTASGSATSTGLTITVSSDATKPYSTSSPASTPWTGAPTVTVGTSGLTVGGHDVANGTVEVLADPGTATTTVGFTYHIVDSWAGTDSVTRRAKVTSTSDTAGEYVSISEVASIGSSTADPDSKIFLGSILLSSNAATQGTNSDGVWVQDGTTLDTDTITVDAVKPTIGAISPADDTVTGTANPSITFEITDAGAGISSDPGSAISIVIVSGSATTTIVSSVPAYQPINDGFRVIQTQNASWLNSTGSGGYAVADSTAFTWIMTATDKAGNSATVTVDLTIDLVKPTVLSGSTNTVTGTGWNADTAAETTGSLTSVKVTFSEDLDASTVTAADFTVGGVAPTASIVGTATGLKDSVYLTVGTLAVDAKPEVVVVGTVQDKAGNSVDTSSSVTTNKATTADGLKPGLTTTISTGLLVATDAVKITVLADEKLAVDGLTVSINVAPATHGPHDLL